MDRLAIAPRTRTRLEMATAFGWAFSSLKRPANKDSTARLSRVAIARRGRTVLDELIQSRECPRVGNRLAPVVMTNEPPATPVQEQFSFTGGTNGRAAMNRPQHDHGAMPYVDICKSR